MRPLKILFCGPQGSGKSTLVKRMMETNDIIEPTVGISVLSRVLLFNDDLYRISTYDTSGKPFYLPFLYKYFQKADVIVLVVCGDCTIKAIQEYIDLIPNQKPFAIVNNKLDKLNCKPYEDLEALTPRPFHYYECSATMRFNSQQILQSLVANICSERRKQSVYTVKDFQTKDANGCTTV